jgi:transforming growth factor-beta-induced protein
MSIKKIISISFSILLIFVLSTTYVFAQHKTIVETAVEAGSFTTLVKAVQEAGLVEALSGPGPLTVFAPTDEAFAEIPADTLHALLQDKEKLTSVLTYHVVAGNLLGAQVVRKNSIITLQGGALSVDISDGIKVDDANIIETDIKTSNGRIHVIDKVLMPKNIVETAVGAGIFNTLVTAVQAAELVDVLSGPGPFTVFAPTDAAFAKVPASVLNELLADKEQLAQVLTYHVVPGKLMAEDVVAMDKIKTVQGSEITVNYDCSGVMVDNAMVVNTDIVTSNGVIHVIDAVILP